MKIHFKKMRPNAVIPKFGNGDFMNAGLDLCSALTTLVYLEPGESAIIPTGIAWEPISGSRCAMIVQSRSGLAFKHGVEASNAGVVDASYRGEIMVKLYNNGDKLYVVEPGERVAQGIVYLLPEITDICEVDELQESARGTNGFGSTGRM